MKNERPYTRAERKIQTETLQTMPEGRLPTDTRGDRRLSFNQNHRTRGVKTMACSAVKEDSFFETKVNFGLVIQTNLRDVDRLKESLASSGVPFNVVYQRVHSGRLWICLDEP